MADTIGTATVDNKQKYDNYREQFRRLKKAFTYKFHLEAVFIAYAIMEDRADSILGYEHNEIVPKSEKEFISIARKLNRISAIAREKKGLANRYFSDSITDELSDWIKRRNALIHALLKKELTDEDVETFAREGEALAKKFCNRARSYKRAVERKGEER